LGDFGQYAKLITYAWLGELMGLTKEEDTPNLERGWRVEAYVWGVEVVLKHLRRDHEVEWHGIA
jgi:hypothetical protein